MPRKKTDIADKKKFLDFVYLSDEEYDQLCVLLGVKGVSDWIEELNIYLGKSEKNRKKYDSHYWAIRGWARRSAAAANSSHTSNTSYASRAADRVIELLKDPTNPYMPSDEPIRSQLHKFLIGKKMNWPQLRAVLKSAPEKEADLRAELLKAYNNGN